MNAGSVQFSAKAAVNWHQIDNYGNNDGAELIEEMNI